MFKTGHCARGKMAMGEITGPLFETLGGGDGYI